MFDFTGLFSRDDDAHETTSSSAAAPERPINYTVFKDGLPFAILNATPALAAWTVAGFRKATPASQWVYEVC